MKIESYIAECADYLRELGKQSDSIYSKSDTTTLLKQLKTTRGFLAKAEHETIKILGKEVGGRTIRTGLEPVTIREMRTRLVQSITLNQIAIEETLLYQEKNKPRKYKMAHSAIRLAHAYFDNGKQKEIAALAEKILNAAGGSDIMAAERTVTNWLKELRH